PPWLRRLVPSVPLPSSKFCRPVLIVVAPASTGPAPTAPPTGPIITYGHTCRRGTRWPRRSTLAQVNPNPVARLVWQCQACHFRVRAWRPPLVAVPAISFSAPTFSPVRRVIISWMINPCPAKGHGPETTKDPRDRGSFFVVDNNWPASTLPPIPAR